MKEFKTKDIEEVKDKEEATMLRDSKVVELLSTNTSQNILTEVATIEDKNQEDKTEERELQRRIDIQAMKNIDLIDHCELDSKYNLFK